MNDRRDRIDEALRNVAAGDRAVQALIDQMADADDPASQRVVAVLRQTTDVQIAPAGTPPPTNIGEALQGAHIVRAMVRPLEIDPATGATTLSDRWVDVTDYFTITPRVPGVHLGKGAIIKQDGAEHVDQSLNGNTERE